MDYSPAARGQHAASDVVGAGFAAAVAALGGATLWTIAGAGLPGWVPERYGAAAALVPLAAGPAALAAGWSALALWRCGRRRWASAGLLTAAVGLLAALLTVLYVPFAFRAAPAGPSAAGLVVFLAVMVPLLTALAADVALLEWAVRLGWRARAALLALAAALLVAGATGWTPLLWSLAVLLPVALATPALAAPFLTGARHAARPRGAPALAAGFFGLPLALLAGLGLAAAGAAAPGGLALGAAVLLLAVLVLAVLGMSRTAVPRAWPRAMPVPVDFVATPAPTVATVQAVSPPAPAADGPRSQVVRLLTDRFLAGDLTLAEYEAHLEHVLRSTYAPPAPQARPDRSR